VRQPGAAHHYHQASGAPSWSLTLIPPGEFKVDVNNFSFILRKSVTTAFFESKYFCRIALANLLKMQQNLCFDADIKKFRRKTHRPSFAIW
jgi:hypothetical protein